MKTSQALAIGCACVFLTAVIASDSMARRRGGEDKPTPATDTQAGVENTEAAPATLASAENPPAAPETGSLSVPAGTKLLVQLTQDVPTSKKAEGKKFMCALQGNLMVAGTVIAAEGSKIYGSVQKMEGSGRKQGMGLVLNEITINGQLQPIVSQPVGVEAARVGGAAAAGAIKGAVVGDIVGHPGGSGASKGAMVGALAGAAKAKQSAGIPAGELLEFYLAEPLVVSGP